MYVFFFFVTDEELKIVGTLIPKSCMEILRQELSSDAENTEELTFWTLGDFAFTGKNKIKYKK